MAAACVIPPQLEQRAGPHGILMQDKKIRGASCGGAPQATRTERLTL